MTGKVRTTDVVAAIEAKGWLKNPKGDGAFIRSLSKDDRTKGMDLDPDKVMDDLEDRLQWMTSEQRGKLVGYISSLPEDLGLFAGVRKIYDAGKLKPVPRVLRNSEYMPVLMFRQNKFLSWYRGYCFQVSGSPDGDGSYGSSSTSLVSDLLSGSYLPERLRPLIALGHVCQATTKYKDFWDIVHESPELLNQLMQRSHNELDSNLMCKEFDFGSVWANIREWEELPPHVTAYGIQLTEKKFKGIPDLYFGSLIFADTFIAVRLFKDNRWNIIDFPMYEEHVRNAGLEEDGYLTKDRYYNLLFYRLSWVLLTKVEVCVYSFQLYPHDRKSQVSFPVQTAISAPDLLFVGDTAELDKAATTYASQM
jgi:hypothetical protein